MEEEAWWFKPGCLQRGQAVLGRLLFHKRGVALRSCRLCVRRACLALFLPEPGRRGWPFPPGRASGAIRDGPAEDTALRRRFFWWGLERL